MSGETDPSETGPEKDKTLDPATKLRGGIIIVAVFTLFGPGLWLIAGYLSVQNILTLTNYQATTGEVVDMLKDETAGQAPIISFTDRTGKNYKFTHPVYSLPAEYETGDAVAVHYDPSQPNNAMITEFSALWVFPLILVGFGALPTILVDFMIKGLLKDYRGLRKQ